MTDETHLGRERTVQERLFELEHDVRILKQRASSLFSKDREYEGHPQFDEHCAEIAAKRGLQC